MSKLDQLKLLGANKRAERNSSRGGGESRPALKEVGIEKDPRMAVDSAEVAQHLTARVAPSPRETKSKGGRPLAKDAAKALSKTEPWKADGMSRASWYRRRKAEGTLP